MVLLISTTSGQIHPEILLEVDLAGFAEMAGCVSCQKLGEICYIPSIKLCKSSLLYMCDSSRITVCTPFFGIV